MNIRHLRDNVKKLFLKAPSHYEHLLAGLCFASPASQQRRQHIRDCCTSLICNEPPSLPSVSCFHRNSGISCWDTYMIIQVHLFDPEVSWCGRMFVPFCGVEHVGNNCHQLPRITASLCYAKYNIRNHRSGCRVSLWYSIVVQVPVRARFFPSRFRGRSWGPRILIFIVATLSKGVK
jgi:hypothetical protein